MRKVVNLLVCFVLVAAASLRMTGSLLGFHLDRLNGSWDGSQTPAISVRDGKTVASSVPLSGKVSGFGGIVDVEATFGDDGRILSVAPVLPNDETPMFFGQLDEGFWNSWNGLSAQEAVAKDVDAVTGATYSSRAAISSVRAAAAAYAKSTGAATAPAAPSGATRIASVAAAIYLAFLAIVPPFAKSRRLRLATLALNVAVLGFWSGMFLSTDRLAKWMSTGLAIRGWDLAAAILMLVMAFAYPLFGRQGYYCAHVCPFGSAQELAGTLPVKKARLAPGLLRALALFRGILWGALMASLWLGAWSGWLGLELFAAFAWKAASIWLLATAAAMLAAAVFVPRPYCRFVCPTGTLLSLPQMK